MMFYYWPIFDIDTSGFYFTYGVFACRSGTSFREFGLAGIIRVMARLSYFYHVFIVWPCGSRTAGESLLLL
jgi:hypothetical protein